MRVNYYGYTLKDITTGENHLVDLRPFLHSFCKLEVPKFKASFIYRDELLYLSRLQGDCFIFLITRNSEIIRRINTSNLTMGEISQLLAEDEQIGFASYVMVQGDNLAYASTLFAPRLDAFAWFINELLDVTGNSNWKFSTTPMLYQATRADALRMEHIGKTTFQLSKSNNIAQDILSLVAVTPGEYEEVDSIEITIRPSGRKSIKDTVGKAIRAIPDEGLQKLVMRAKEEASSQMMDLYIAGKGSIGDNITKSDEVRIPELLKERHSKNAYLSEKLKEFRESGSYKKSTPSSISDYGDLRTWVDLTSHLQEGDKAQPRLVDEPIPR